MEYIFAPRCSPVMLSREKSCLSENYRRAYRLMDAIRKDVFFLIAIVFIVV
jgi:hypothetical protein